MKRIATGVIIILAGISLLFYHSGFLPENYFRVIFSWPSLLIAIGAIQLTDNKRCSNHKDAGIILIFVGLVFITPKILAIWLPEILFNSHHVRGFVLSALIIAFGVFLILKSHKKKNTYRYQRYSGDFASIPFLEMPINDSGYIKREYVFTAIKERITPIEIKKVEIEAVFSGVEIDFSQTELSQEVDKIHIKVSSVFSGVTLYFPSEWNILIQKTGVFGGFNDKRFTKSMPNPNGKLVFLELEAVFGGGEVKYYE
jgi:predicted membrane protein